jgi:hypothetical protein
MKFVIIQFSPTSCHFISLQRHFSKTLNLCSSLNVTLYIYEIKCFQISESQLY